MVRQKGAKTRRDVDFGGPGLDFILAISPVALFRVGFSPPDHLKKNEIAGLRLSWRSAAANDDILQKTRKMPKNGPKKMQKNFPAAFARRKKCWQPPKPSNLESQTPIWGG